MSVADKESFTNLAEYWGNLPPDRAPVDFSAREAEFVAQFDRSAAALMLEAHRQSAEAFKARRAVCDYFKSKLEL